MSLEPVMEVNAVDILSVLSLAVGVAGLGLHQHYR